MHFAVLLLALAVDAGDTLAPRLPPRIDVHDNVAPAGRLRDRILTMRLGVVQGRWFPDGEDGYETIHAFAEGGGTPSVPGPMIRIPEGTEIRITIRNPLDSTLVLYGLHARPGAADDTVQVGPRSEREIRFSAGAPGTYYYWGTTTGASMRDLRGLDSQLSGAFIVDSAGARADDRVFVIGMWFKPTTDSAGPGARQYADLMVINGRMWPHTERLRFTAGDSVHWRWINATESSHPMHLHGFYYRVDAQGDWSRDTAYAEDAKRLVVTQLMMPGSTMSMSWVPARSGNWVFHCHFAFHVSHWLKMSAPDTSQGAHRHHQMSGLVLGLYVEPRAADAAQAAIRPARRLRLLIQEAPKRFDSVPGYGFILQDPRAPHPDSVPSDSVPRSGPTIELTRGEPVAITVVNRMRQMTGIHWHGIELESFPDGIPGWSGMPGRLMPPVMPGDSFVAEFVPPRSGTFMYHAHSNEDAQISGGLYGALIVSDSGAMRDRVLDRIILIGASGPFPNSGTFNGELSPQSTELRAGRAYRFRLIQIQPDWRVNFRIFDEQGRIVTWVPVAKDGADLPASLRKPKPAAIQAGPGETADFEFTPTAPGRYRMELTSQGTGWHTLRELVVRK